MRRPFPWEASYPTGIAWDAPITVTTLPAMLDRAVMRFADKPAIEHAKEPVGLLDMALHGVGNALRRVLHEVVVLAGHGSEAAHLPEHPLERCLAAAHVGADEAAGLLGEIDEDRA